MPKALFEYYNQINEEGEYYYDNFIFYNLEKLNSKLSNCSELQIAVTYNLDFSNEALPGGCFCNAAIPTSETDKSKNVLCYLPDEDADITTSRLNLLTEKSAEFASSRIIVFTTN